MKLFRYDYDVKNSSSGFNLSNTVLSSPYDPSPMNKLMKDLDWFFTQNHHRFKKIQLKIDFIKDMDLNIVVKLLTIIFPFMEELEFCGVWAFYGAQNHVQFECKFPSDDYFKRVKKVSVSLDYGGNIWNEFKTLISTMKMNNVKEIDLYSPSDLFVCLFV
jgi:hypothetical protein